MAAGGGGIVQIIWLIVMLYIIVEFALPLARKLINSFRARQAYPATATVSYM